MRVAGRVHRQLHGIHRLVLREVERRLDVAVRRPGPDPEEGVCLCADRGVRPGDEAAELAGTLAPHGVAAMVMLRLAGGPPGARELAEAVAVLGGDATLANVASLARLEPDAARSVAADLARGASWWTATRSSSSEIAQELYVTEKTVEGHLRNAYDKLEIGSRLELREALAAGTSAGGSAVAT